MSEVRIFKILLCIIGIQYSILLSGHVRTYLAIRILNNENLNNENLSTEPSSPSTPKKPTSTIHGSGCNGSGTSNIFMDTT